MTISFKYFWTHLSYLQLLLVTPSKTQDNGLFKYRKRLSRTTAFIRSHIEYYYRYFVQPLFQKSTCQSIASFHHEMLQKLHFPYKIICSSNKTIKIWRNFKDLNTWRHPHSHHWHHRGTTWNSRRISHYSLFHGIKKTTHAVLSTLHCTWTHWALEARISNLFL